MLPRRACSPTAATDPLRGLTGPRRTTRSRSASASSVPTAPHRVELADAIAPELSCSLYVATPNGTGENCQSAPRMSTSVNNDHGTVGSGLVDLAGWPSTRWSSVPDPRARAGDTSSLTTL